MGSSFYHFPSLVGTGNATPHVSTSFRVEFKGALLLKFNDITADVASQLKGRHGRLDGDGVVGLPQITSRQRSAAYYLKGILDGSVQQRRLVPNPSSSLRNVLMIESGERNHMEKDSWQIHYDPDLENNNNVSEHVFDTFWNPALGVVGMRSDYEMISVEIVSPDWQWDQHETHLSVLSELFELLLSDDNMYFVTASEHTTYRRQNVSVHFGLKGQEEIDTNVLRQILILYGLSESTIEDLWKPRYSFDTPLPQRIRLGMEKLLVDRSPLATPGKKPSRRRSRTPSLKRHIVVDNEAHFYTHDEYAGILSQQHQSSDLKSKISGYPTAELYSDGTPRPYGPTARDNTTVTISAADKEKQKHMSVEFKHRIDSEDFSRETAFFIQLCGYLFSYVIYLTNLDIKVGEPGFAKEILAGDLLKLISLPEEAQQHFKAKAVDNMRRTPGFSTTLTKREVDEDLIKRRQLKRRKYCLPTDVAGEMKNLEALSENFQERELALLPADLPFIARSETRNFLNYLRNREMEMLNADVALPAPHTSLTPDANDSDAMKLEKIRQTEVYLLTTIADAWIDYSGHPYMRRARMERGVVPEIYAHPEEMPLRCKEWLIRGERPEKDETLPDGSVIVGRRTIEKRNARRRAARVEWEQSRLRREADEPADLLDYESDGPVVNSLLDNLRIDARAMWKDITRPSPGQSWQEFMREFFRKRR